MSEENLSSHSFDSAASNDLEVEPADCKEVSNAKSEPNRPPRKVKHTGIAPIGPFDGQPRPPQTQRVRDKVNRILSGEEEADEAAALNEPQPNIPFAATATAIPLTNSSTAAAPPEPNATPSSFFARYRWRILILIALLVMVGTALIVVFTVVLPRPVAINAEPMKCVDKRVSSSTTDGSTFHEKNCPNDSLTTENRGKWFKIPGDGYCVTLSTCNKETKFDTRLRIYREEGEQETRRICHAGNDDAKSECPLDSSSSMVTFRTEPGVWYFVLVDGFKKDDHGNFTLSIDCGACATVEPTHHPTAPSTDSATEPIWNSAVLTASPTISPTISPTTSPTTAIPTPPPTLIIPAQIFDILAQVSSADDLNDPSSAQHQAARWAVDDKSANPYNNNPTLVQRYVLALLYYSTNGRGWERQADFLNHAKSECQWVSIDECIDGAVVTMDLDHNNLAGPIPSELGSLTKVKHLDLDGNSLTGTIPSSLGSLSNLPWLYLNNNELTGTIPRSLGSLTNLGDLSLSRNSLTGTIPSSLGSLTNLYGLILSRNSLTGTIPWSLGSLTSLRDLTLSKNSLTGTIPSSLGSLTNLDELNLDRNSLTGTIPLSLGSLSNLEYLSIYYTELTGDAEFLCSLPNRNTFWVDKEKVDCSCCIKPP